MRYSAGLAWPNLREEAIQKKFNLGLAVFSILYAVGFWFIPIGYTRGNGTYYSSGPAAAAAFLIPVVFFTATTVMIIVKRKLFGRHVVMALLPMLMVLFLAETVEIVWTEILITGGCATLATVGVYFAVENHVLLEAMKHAKSAEKAKSMFLASMSHEIRTPLNTVIGFSELLRDKGHSREEQDEYLLGITSVGNTLLALINDVLDLSKLEAGQVVFKPDQIEFTELALEMRSIFHRRCLDKGVDFYP